MCIDKIYHPTGMMVLEIGQKGAENVLCIMTNRYKKVEVNIARIFRLTVRKAWNSFNGTHNSFLISSDYETWKTGLQNGIPEFWAVHSLMDLWKVLVYLDQYLFVTLKQCEQWWQINLFICSCLQLPGLKISSYIPLSLEALHERRVDKIIDVQEAWAL